MAKKTQAEKAAQNEETAKGNDDLMNDDEEPNFSDPEGFVDDITDEGEHLVIFFLVDVFKAMTRLHLSPALRCKHGESFISNVQHLRFNLQKSLAIFSDEPPLISNKLFRMSNDGDNIAHFHIRWLPM